MTHWLARVAQSAGFDHADDLRLEAHLGVGRAWARVLDVCGIDSHELAAAVGRFFHVSVADLGDAEATALKLLPESVARKLQAVPLRDLNRRLLVAVSDPTDPDLEHEIGFASGRTPALQVAAPDDIAAALERGYGQDAVVETFLSGIRDSAADVVQIHAEEAEAEGIRPMEAEARPIVNLVNMILDEAVKQGASDIHLQPHDKQGVVRFRVDGVLRTAAKLPLPVLPRVVSRVKVLGNLDIADRLRAQDGRVRVTIRGSLYDLRISTVPTRRQEKAVIRVLDPGRSLALDQVEIEEPDLGRIRRSLGHRDGIFVVTGPTGSGKTTTLYAALREISNEDVNIMTVEDPVEYELPGLTQIQVEQAHGVTFASALRAILRQDPDVIFVGEIRDAETAAIAAQASLTGHLVLATLHTNDAVGALRRFVDLGLDVNTVVETLRAVLAQRLVRRVCRDCAVPVADALTDEEEELAARYGVRPTMRAIGCERCSDSGYRGRLPVTEFMAVTDGLVRKILGQAPPADVQAQARADGMRTLLEAALERVKAGQTTLQEVARVVGEEDGASTAGQASTSGPASSPSAAEARQVGTSGPEAGRVDGGVAGHDGDSTGPKVGAPGEAAHDDRPDADPAAGRRRVLIVDDDRTVRTIAGALLEKEGYAVVTAADGSEGLSFLARGDRFDLMILDLDMPLLGGREVLSAVRKNIATMSLPVIVLTGTDDPGAELELLEKGADDYLGKPIEPARFLTRVKAVLRRSLG